ncbi:metacaspase-2-like [Condylostylus longicornis]|uniref:metacaspase-2-like n=1 Tax=Condylostylus longicornis TaxID=2530218 RepID=UPI00244E4557|nr:metacaspase-2-like [Condylostylus longicornis]
MTSEVEIIDSIILDPLPPSAFDYAITGTSSSRVTSNNNSKINSKSNYNNNNSKINSKSNYNNNNNNGNNRKRRRSEENIDGILDTVNEKVIRRNVMKRALRVGDIVLNKYYQVNKIERKNTVYGQPLMLEFENTVFFLPEFMKDFLTDEQISKINVESDIVMICHQKGKCKLVVEPVQRVTENSVVLRDQSDDWCGRTIAELLTKFDDFQEKGSGWALSSIINLVVNINSYTAFVADRRSSYPNYEDILNFNGIKFPVLIKDISKFEKLNKISKQKINCHSESNINDNDVEIKYHYVLIKDLSRLLSQDINKKEAQICFICDQPFTEKNIKCKDHDHLNGEYRGAAHQNCNINYKNSFYVPVVFHNLSGYDSHFIIKELNSVISDIFEKFRKFCMETYDLDPLHYFTLPGFSWDAMLKYTNVNFELLTDIDMILFIENGVRGGLTQVSKRYSKANNKYMNDFDSSLQSQYLMYFDVNNQYGWNFILNISDKNGIGYIFEVDLNYPTQLHDIHRDLPFCPEHLLTDSNEKKIVATLYNKDRYVLHYRSLKLALKNGLEVTKIHKILKFIQSDFLRPYIELNTKLRAQSKDNFSKELFKLINNAIFGKTIENVRKHCNIKLKTYWHGRYGVNALIASPYFKSSAIFNENLVAIELYRNEIYFNKPIYVGTIKPQTS